MDGVGEFLTLLGIQMIFFASENLFLSQQYNLYMII